jgi:hypothetical protein
MVEKGLPWEPGGCEDSGYCDFLWEYPAGLAHP